MGMAAATCSDLVALQGISTIAAWRDSIWFTFGLHIFLIVISVVAVGLNSLDLPAGYTPANPHIPDNRIFFMSIAALILVSVTYSATHATLTDQEKTVEELKAEAQKKTVESKQAIIDRIKQCLAKAKNGGENCLKEVE